MLKNITINSDIDFSLVKKMVRNEIIPHETSDPEGQVFTDKFAKKLHDLGVLQAITPKVYGGKEWSVSDLAWLIREISYGSASQAATIIGNLLGYSALVMYANEDLRNKVCRQYNVEFGLWSFGMTEEKVGSDLRNIKTTAIQTTSGFIINGEKNFITNSAVSSNMCIFAQTIDRSGKNLGVSCFYIPGLTKGVSRGSVMNKIAWKKANTGTILFNDVQIPKAHLLGKPGQGLKILTHCLNRSKTLLGAMGVGIADRALDLSISRLSSTKRYGKSLLNLAALKHLFGNLHTQKEAAWLLTCNAAATWDAGLPAVKESSMAKYFSGKMSVNLTNQCMETFGARGLFNEYEISRLNRDAKGIEIIEGPSMIQELLIAKAILPREEQREEETFKLARNDLGKVA